jgi:hypothetical protein
MRAIKNESNVSNPQMDDILGKRAGAWCLCPAWMGWMPWLVDGVEVGREQGRRKEGIRIRNIHQAGLNG